MSIVTIGVGGTLESLAREITEEHEAILLKKGEAIEHARRCGERLLEVKSRMKCGEWLSWLGSNVRVSPRMASNYMKISRNWDAIVRFEKRASDPETSIRRVMLMLSSDEKVSKAEAILAELAAKLPEPIRAAHEDYSCRLNAGQIRTLLGNESLGEIERAMRVGQAATAKEAYKKVTGAALKGTKPPAGAAVKDDEPEPELPDPSPEERMKAANKKLESACRAVMKAFEEHLAPLAAENPWLTQYGRIGSAKGSLTSALTTARTARGSTVCPRCDGGIGCGVCLYTGYVIKSVAMQLAE